MLHKLCAIVNIKWPTTTSSVRPSAMLCHAYTVRQQHSVCDADVDPDTNLTIVAAIAASLGVFEDGRAMV